MKMEPIMEVLMSDDGQGEFCVRLKETELNTQTYAKVLLMIARNIASMFVTGSNGKFEQEFVYDEIMRYLRDEMEKPMASAEMRVLQ